MTPNGITLRRELIVKTKRETGLRASGADLSSTTGANVSQLADLLKSEGVILKPLFGSSEERVRAKAASVVPQPGTSVPDLSTYYTIEAPDQKLDAIAERLRQLEEVEAAYVKPPAEPAQFRLNDMVPQAGEPAVATPNFTSRQGYLGPAPVGIDAQYAWGVPGGRGGGTNVIDIEWGWVFTHEDLQMNQGGVVSGTGVAGDQHGTAVIGTFSADQNGFGVTGISSDAHVSAVSLNTHPTAQAIRIAADRLNPGDVILLEVHRFGPRSPEGTAQFGYIPIEWWPDDYDAIRYAISKGVIVVEAGGNGGQNLDDPIYGVIPPGFPPTWKNPFNPLNPTSGAILVGAGMPPAGTHGRSANPFWGDVYTDRGRCFFSNYGARVDVQGWGWEVTTTGYGDLQGGSDENNYYTDQFSGTSSASPIIVGVLACVQGVLRAHGRPLLTPARAQQLLRVTGVFQQDAPGFTFLPDMLGSGWPQEHPSRPRTQRIGNRPNLRQLISSALGTSAITAPLYRYWSPEGLDHFYTTNWSELEAARYGWHFEMVQCHVYRTAVTGFVPLHRYWNAAIADHFYTTNWAELGNGKYGWKYEGIACYVLPSQAAGTLPLHRYWHPTAGDHFYTTDFSELGNGFQGWIYEGVQCYVFPVPPAAPPASSGTDAALEGTSNTLPGETSAPGDTPVVAVPGASLPTVLVRVTANIEQVPASFAIAKGDAQLAVIIEPSS